MIKQLDRQLKACGGLAIEWHFAEKEPADVIRKIFQQMGYDGIKIIHTP